MNNSTSSKSPEAKPDPLPLITELLATTESANLRLYEIMCRLATAREKLYGAEPEATTSGVGDQKPPGAVWVLRWELEKSHSCLSDIEELLTKIERFV